MTWHETIAGYVVVHTRIGEGAIADVERFASGDYASAVALAHDVRMSVPLQEYARIDVLYTDGTRGIL